MLLVAVVLCGHTTLEVVTQAPLTYKETPMEQLFAVVTVLDEVDQTVMVVHLEVLITLELVAVVVAVTRTGTGITLVAVLAVTLVVVAKELGDITQVTVAVVLRALLTLQLGEPQAVEEQEFMVKVLTA